MKDKNDQKNTKNIKDSKEQSNNKANCYEQAIYSKYIPNYRKYKTEVFSTEIFSLSSQSKLSRIL